MRRVSLGCSEFIRSLSQGGADGQRPVFAHGNAPFNQLRDDSCPPTSPPLKLDWGWDRGQGRRLRNSPCSFHRQRGLDLGPSPRVGEAGLNGTPGRKERSQARDGAALLPSPSRYEDWSQRLRAGPMMLQ